MPFVFEVNVVVRLFPLFLNTSFFVSRCTFVTAFLGSVGAIKLQRLFLWRFMLLLFILIPSVFEKFIFEFELLYWWWLINLFPNLFIEFIIIIFLIWLCYLLPVLQRSKLFRVCDCCVQHFLMKDVNVIYQLARYGRPNKINR